MQDEFEGQDGSQDSTAAVTPPQPSEEVLRTRQERDALREENRKLHAQALGKEHNLPDFAIETLAGIPKDQQEAKAKTLAEELEKFRSQGQQKTEAPAPTGDQQQDEAQQEQPPTESADAAQAAGMQPTGTPPQVPPAAGGEGDLSKRLAEAKSYQEVVQIQDEMRRSQRT